MGDTVRQLLENQLIAEWGVTTYIDWDDTDYAPTPGVEFIRCTLDEIGAVPKGSRCQREDHLLTIQVFTPGGKGSKGNMLLCDQLKAIFLGFRSGNLDCKAVTTERIGEYKEWYQRNVLVDVQYDNHY